MDLKEQVLEILEENRGQHYSGALIADELGVTRAAVSKAVGALRSDGHEISSLTNRGYCLSEQSDVLSAQGIARLLGEKSAEFCMHVYQSVCSTNTVLKEMAQAGAQAGTVVIARQQTAGRGRFGRSFYSPPSGGLYLSVLLRPELGVQESLFITTAVAVAVAQAIEAVFPQTKVGIKWVNDLYVAGKKVCGILTEASLDFESGKLEYAVVGIGVNISTKDFPEDISAKAGAIQGQTQGPVKMRLAAEILTRVMEEMRDISSHKHLDEYRNRSVLLGREVDVLCGDAALPATVLEINDQANLVVRLQDGSKKVLSSGEVSIRPKKI